jgi:nucleoside-diphosphate-sugar epimerase
MQAMTALQNPLLLQAGTPVSLSGAGGYLGRALINDFLKSDRYFSALVHSTRESGSVESDEKYFRGDLLRNDALSGWLKPGQTVVHLAYMWTAGEAANIQATKNLLAACQNAGVKRLVHVSTAAVVGRSETDWVDEKTPCRPVTEYGRTKLKIEEVMRDFSASTDIDVVVLRPTSVFGPGAAPLEKLCRDLRESGWLSNYMRACLFGSRAMNLVHIDNVIAAIRFAIDFPGHFAGETLIVSDDDAPKNNFRDVESTLRAVLGLGGYPVPLVSLPRFVLELLLRAMRRNIVNTRCRFSAAKMREMGFVPSLTFENALIGYAEWDRDRGGLPCCR